MKLDFEKKAFGAGDEVVAKLELNTNENKPLSDYKIKFVANLDGEKIVEQADVTDIDGIKYIKFNLQTGFSGQAAGEGNITGSSLPAYMSLGIVFNYAPRFSKDDPSGRKKRIKYRKGDE